MDSDAIRAIFGPINVLSGINEKTQGFSYLGIGISIWVTFAETTIHTFVEEKKIIDS